jgi:chemotaxis protein MotB
VLEAPPEKKAAAAGSPAWMTTFADLMSLLMCFFVLLLSFSEMDLQKYKQVAGSMAQAFGVQREIKGRESPMGTSFVAREFAPGKPEPSPIKVLQQKSSHLLPHLDAGQDEQKRLKKILQSVKAGLAEEIRKGSVSIETEGNRVIIRIQEKSSFASGSAEVLGQFMPTLAKIARVLTDVPGEIVVAGHTDNIPISSGRFRSNWELSASRAVTVLQAILANADIPAERLRVEGHGDIHPLAPNDTPDGRALNRRVEISLIQTSDSSPPA